MSLSGLPALASAQSVRLPGDSVRLPRVLHPALGQAPLGPRLGPATLETPFAVDFPGPPGLDRPDLWPRFADWTEAWRRLGEARRAPPRVPRLGDGPRAGELIRARSPEAARRRAAADAPAPDSAAADSAAPGAPPPDAPAARTETRADDGRAAARDADRQPPDRRDAGRPPPGDRAADREVSGREAADRPPPPIGADPERPQAPPPDSSAADSVVYLVRPPVLQRDTVRTNPDLPGPFSQLGDLGVHLRGRADMTGEWNKIEPCNIFVALNCESGVVPRISPDIQFQLLVGGTISERVHVDVDFDQAREFDATNNINVFYQGFEDEILRRVEVGDVNLRLPRSRYMTQGVPAGNFGFKAEGQVGPIDFQTVWAQQKGDITEREFVFGGGGAGESVVLDQSVVWDDESYLSGLFFFLVPPDSLAGAPHVDALALQPGDVPASLRPDGAFGIQVYRAQAAGNLDAAQQADQNLFRAVAVAGEGAERVEHAGLFRQLEPVEDYEIHSSGIWIVLRSRLAAGEALAISFVTETGDTVGTPDAESVSAQGLTPTLRLLRGPEDIHQPGRPTWRQEMHNVYRVDASNEVERGSVSLTVSLGEESAGATFVTTPDGTRATYLRFFGLDEDNPVDELDEAQLFRPGELFGSDTKVGGVYVIFPTLEPFARPAPVPSLGLTADAAAALLGNDANRVIYDDPDPIDRANASRFRLNFDYRVRSAGGTRSSFNLGAIGIREGSERIFVGNQRLVAGEDYTIDYELGTLNLLNPDVVFGANPNVQMRATWEQQPLFQIAPKSVFGMNARYQAGDLGEVNVLGIFQSERSLVNRPQLGLEPGALFVGGVTGDLDLPSGFLDRAVGSIPGLRTSGRSTLRVTGEVAMSAPNPNSEGDTYLDDFEGANEAQLSTISNAWRHGSAPAWTPGAGSFLPVSIGTHNAAAMTWQSQYAQADGDICCRPRAADIDRTINTIGSDTGEPVMFIALQDTLTAGRSWRSITTVLSTTGRDLTQSEFLEFYVERDPTIDIALVWDIGTVSEDAFVFDSLGNLTGAYPDGEPWGLGLLDQEADLGFAVWSDSLDQRGLWDQSCQGARQSVFALGSFAANCPRGNGLNDTEDLDGNGALLASDGAHFRFTVPLGEASPYLVRDRSQTGTAFELYRIPLRTGMAEAANGADESTWRFVRHVRLTVSADLPDRNTVLTLARPKLLGGRWPKREGHGVVQGLTGSAPGASSAAAAVSVAPVSRVIDPAYVSPPNTGDRAQDVTAGVATSRQEINERALRLTYRDVGPGERAEVFFRYLTRPRDLLEYRRVRLWALPRAGAFGEGGDQFLLLKFGTDGENYYLRRTRLDAPAVGDVVARGDWVDVPMDFQEWIDLRVAAEDSLIRRVAPPDPDGPIVVGAAAGSVGDPLGAPEADGRVEIWNADSTYAVVLQDRARAPNLASIRELSLAVYNDGDFPSSGEVWFNELRLDEPDTRSGVATDVNVALSAADFMTASVSFSSESERFQRGLDNRPDFEADRSLAISSRMQFGNFAPTSWGLDLPVQVSHNSIDTNPFFLNRSDVFARGLEGLRDIGSSSTSVGVALRKRTPTANPWVSAVVDGLSLNANWRTSESSASTTRSEASGVSAGVGYDRRPGAREFDATPGFLEDALRWLLPGFVERSRLFQNLTAAQLRWSPSALSLQTSYQDTDARTFRFDRILEVPGDTLFEPTSSPATSLRSQARISLQPFRTMDATFGISSNRDLLDPVLASESPDVRAALERERGRFLGLGMGWERNRTMSTAFAFSPEVVEWLRPGLTWNTQYAVDRNPSFVGFEAEGADSVARLQRQFGNSRTLGRQLRFSPAVLGTIMIAAGGADAAGWKRGLNAVLSRLNDIDLRWQDGLSSQFDRELASPGLGYQFGFGDAEDFQTVDGATARATRETDQFTAQSGLDLPLGSTLSVGYETSDASALAERGGSQDSEARTWPDLNWRWSRVPVPSFLEGRIAGMNLSAGFRRTERQNRFGGTTQSRGTEETAIPIRFSMTTLNGMALTYNGTLSEGLSQDPTGRTERSNNRHSVELRGSMDGPEGWQALSQPIHATLSYRRDAQSSCRTRFSGPEQSDPCTATSAFVTQTLSMQLDTVLDRINLGANLSYTDRQSSTGIREGNRQILLTLFGQFDFQFGRLPGPVGGLR